MTEYTSRDLAEQTAEMLNRNSGHHVVPSLDDDHQLYFIVDHQYDVRGELATGGDGWTVIPHEKCRICGTPCDICRMVPRDSGAQYDMARVEWENVALNVCSNCVHADPVSITALGDAAARITAEAPKYDVGEDPWAPDVVHGDDVLRQLANSVLGPHAAPFRALLAEHGITVDDVQRVLAGPVF